MIDPAVINLGNPARGHSLMGHPAFDWIRGEEIPSLNLFMHEFRHRATGAVHYHLECDNPENVFLVALRTVPMDSTGVAHILEHTALCGSRKYPVRDPFFMMIRRSLNTFMNAFTSSDWTAYPFASKNHKDYFNLLDVYLDAVFFARLDELDFAQEGHRLEFSEPGNSNSELQFKGVVFNEMKGAMSSINSLLWKTMSSHLFPTTTYHFNSGGDPEHIPDLSYKQLRDFYESHYHPSNAIFMTFGSIPVSEIQEQLENLALSHFKRLEVNIAVQDEVRFKSPLRVREHYVCDQPIENKTHVVCGWLLGHSTNLLELYRAQILSTVLLDNSASPLMQVLETTQLGKSPSPLCGLEDSNREMSFLCGLEGCPSGSESDVEALILETLSEIVANGVPQEQVEAALHQLELSQREISGDSYPYGLQLLLSGLSTASHRGDPISLLNIDPVLAELRKQAEDSRFVPDLIDQLLLSNPHRVTLAMEPDPTLAERQVQSEKNRLNRIRESLGQDQVQVIIERSKALEQRQHHDTDPDILPKIGIDDVPSMVEEPRYKEISIPARNTPLPLSFYGQGTNGLCYQQIVTTLPEIDARLLDCLPLYTSCLAELGIDRMSYAEVQVWQSRVCGGVNAYSSVRGHRDNVQKSSGYMVISSKSLCANHQLMTELLAKTLQAVRFDEADRVRDLIEQMCARREAGVSGQGHSLAMTLASSQMSPTANLQHNFSGLEGIRRLKQLRVEIDDSARLARLLDQFAELHQLLLKSRRQILLIAESGRESQLVDEVARIWGAIDHAADCQQLSLPSVLGQIRQVWTIPTQVSYCAKAYPTVPPGHEDYATLTVLANLLRNGFLHRAIREQGGAYGAGADQDADSGSFRFYSYRDPRLDETFADFDRALDWLQKGNHPYRLVEEAILGVIGAMDKSVSPSGSAKRAFFNRIFGRSLQHREAFRQQVLQTSLDDLQRVAGRWLTPDKASIGIVTSAPILQQSAYQCLETIGL